MATKQLDLIATKPVRNRKPVMPRIYCKDGVSLSVQASSQHYAPTKANPGITRGDDEGPWIALEVGYIHPSTAFPMEWQAAFVESHWSAFNKHDRGSVPDDIMNPVYCLDIEEIRKFIESHGGEAEGAELLSLQARAKFDELQRAIEEESAVFKGITEGLKSGDPEAQHRTGQTLANDFNRVRTTVGKLESEWQALRQRAEIAYTDELGKLVTAKYMTGK